MSKTIMMNYTRQPLSVMKRYIRIWQSAICLMPMNVLPLKEFNDDISILQEARKKAETKGDASEIAQIDRSIEKRTEIKNEDIFKLDAEQFKKNMNWEQVFGNLDKVSTDTLKKLKANLKDFISSQKDLSPESLKELVDAIERIDDKVSERDPFETMSILSNPSKKSRMHSVKHRKRITKLWKKVLMKKGRMPKPPLKVQRTASRKPYMKPQMLYIRN